ncbi:MAG: glycoside hydrolase family 3 C-terminal domain-containing protein [Oscillospiraceae bacterium]|nr:glycoside hydrolase family 3 C-terminal domain-containing protein [Oscillospiraceae bacterium]
MVRITSSEVQDFERAHLSKLRALAPECMVLLKKNGDFPLSAPCEIALYGAGARETIKGGTGSGDVNVRHYTTVEEGLENAGFTVTTKAWMDGYKAARDAGIKVFYDAIAEEAKQLGKSVFLVGMGRTPPEPHYELPLDGAGDVCVYVLSRNSGEGADRPGNEGDLLLTDDEQRDILRCAEAYEKFMLVLNVGGPVDLSPVLERVDNILLLSQLGSVTGDAFADVLLGRAYPSGKLTTTWAAAKDAPEIGDFAQRDDTRYREGVFVGYRYYDAAGVRPLFPFGFGLGYTEFSVSAKSFAVKDNCIRVSVIAENIGRFPGKETIPLYYSAPCGRLAKPLRELGAYQKTNELQPGAREEVSLTLPLEDMASWDEASDAWLLEQGKYQICVGETLVGVVTLSDNVTVETGSHSGGAADFSDWAPQTQRSESETVPNIIVPASALNGIGHYRRRKIAPQPLAGCDLSDFTDRELALICVGKHSESQNMASIIGNSASRLAGGAGETAALVREKGYGTIVMADGPAGLRLSTAYIETEAGQEGIDDGAFDSILNILPMEIQQLIAAKLLQNKEKAKASATLYHYASAIPIGTALAQSWSDAVCEQCGDIVGEEMELFGANVWLAPALNIHRSPLCGRNFEYYSEDPVISGRAAAAVTRGVQRHPKCAVTIKHFACNNQETNRYGSNSVVSQRALREIYLKGFEICVKEAAPMALMTSYNLLNGIHTANRQDLLSTILRDEWGFEGIVMTDWGTTNDKFNLGSHGASSPAVCIQAGNDLIMPGGTEDVDGILSGLEDGTLSRAALEICAGRILALSQRLS